MDEMYYYAFCIGYDLMNDYFQKSEMPQCDVVFEECKKLSKEFMKSDAVYKKCKKLSEKFMNSKEYNDLRYSAYESLTIWLENNKEKIQRDYIDDKENSETKRKTKDKIKER